MITDGIDRLHGETPTASQLGPGFGPRGTTGPTVYHSMPTISVDADSASETSNATTLSSSAFTRPGLKTGTLQRIKIWTEKFNSEIAALDNVWVPGLQDKGNDKNK